eukprot:CAMPEP_0180811804 /NCGR_PEP_ID=MMETSP1038_2-20121128/65638_1 /TAXON_ID=632150 /ORGANISM="Azadinium spinosum, Strain 3D9" /LENGTH=219 /DNA_ID=CAMNT_0022853235 /DNA_START=23 /DNA_END=680 /DNA_ORIENTATION=+
MGRGLTWPSTQTSCDICNLLLEEAVVDRGRTVAPVVRDTCQAEERPLKAWHVFSGEQCSPARSAQEAVEPHARLGCRTSLRLLAEEPHKKKRQVPCLGLWQPWPGRGAVQALQQSQEGPLIAEPEDALEGMVQVVLGSERNAADKPGASASGGKHQEMEGSNASPNAASAKAGACATTGAGGKGPEALIGPLIGRGGRSGHLPAALAVAPLGGDCTAGT